MSTWLPLKLLRSNDLINSRRHVSRASEDPRQPMRPILTITIVRLLPLLEPGLASYGVSCGGTACA